MSDYIGPTNLVSKQINAEKHRCTGESFNDAVNRRANALADDDKHFKAYRNVIGNMRFLEGGRVQASIGSPRQTTAFNCFVSGTIKDSFVEGEGSIMRRALEAAETMRRGGGIGYDFSTLRPKGARICRIDSSSSGPISFMDIFNSVCKCVSSSGHRRGAQMGVLRVDHPDIVEFIHAKQNQKSLTGFNISVAITDQFMEAVLDPNPNAMFDLVFEGRKHSEVNAKYLWEDIMRSTFDWAEPGVLFIDRINEMNNLYYCEKIAATNPCGEQPLPPYGACLLGSFNLTKYVRDNGVFNYDLYGEDIDHVVRAMDNIIDRTNYPLIEQEKEAKLKRRMGLGITGLANAMEMLGYSYGSEEFLHKTERVLEFHTSKCYIASAFLAKEKEPFPLYDKDKYLNSNFIRTLPDNVIDCIEKYGIRNSHLTSIAPTGTISLCADNISSGIEPVPFLEYERDIIDSSGDKKKYSMKDYAYERHGIEGKTISTVTIDEHVDTLILASRYMDSAVSKTCNVPNGISWEDFKNVYIRAYKGGCKGCTTYRMGCRREGILKESTENLSCEFDPVTGKKECE